MYAKIVFFATFVAYLAPWVVLYVIFGISIRADVNEDSCGIPFIGGAEKRDPPDFVWIAVIGLFVLFTSFAVVHIVKIYRRRKTERECLQFEVVYSFLSFTSKIILLANIAGGILGRSENNVTEADRLRGLDDTESIDLNGGGGDSDDFAEVWTYVGVALGSSTLLGTFLFVDLYRQGLYTPSSASNPRSAYGYKPPSYATVPPPAYMRAKTKAAIGNLVF